MKLLKEDTISQYVMPKEMDTHELSNKKFKMFVIKMLTELQEATNRENNTKTKREVQQRDRKESIK